MNLSRSQCSLVLSNEIANVASALRQSVRWDNDAFREDSEEAIEDVLLEEFFSLQQKVLYMRHWEVVDPFEYVSPFLDAIRSERVGASITNTALTSIWKLLTSNVMTASHENSSRTLKHIVNSLQECRFEATSNDVHEAVVTRLVQVLVACVCADLGFLLSADDVVLVMMNVWNWCELGPNSKEAMMKPSSIFVQTVRYSLEQMISCLFSRLRTCRVFPDGSLYADFSPDPTGELHLPRSHSAFQNGSVQFDDIHGAVATLSCGIVPFQHILSHCTEQMSIQSDGLDSSDLILFALQLLHAAIVHAGEAIAEYNDLLVLVKIEVFPALSVCLQRQSQRIHASVFQVVFAMYKLFGDELLLQIECFFQMSVLRLCEGRNCPSQEHQEIALEALLDFCGYPGFLRDIYLNLDCKVERSNLFEDICALLSKTAFPVKNPLHAVHMISMEGLLAMLLTLSTTCSREGARAIPITEPKAELPAFIDIWSDIFNGTPPKLETVLDSEFVQNNCQEGEDVLLVRIEKSLKRKIAIAVDHFNKDYKKGFQYLQSIKLIPEDNDPLVIAKFLRVCPHLNGHIVGEMLGEANEFYQKILEHFTETFDFKHKNIESALRMYFDEFKVPGEAQKIDRVVSVFSRVYFTSQIEDVFKNEDAVHVLAYSIIMLNTDLHKPEIKNKMTIDQFVRNNRGINDKEDFPREMIERIYCSIRDQPMKIGDGNAPEISSALWMNLNQMSNTSRGRKKSPLKIPTALDRDMFALVWGPSVAAISVMLDQAEDTTTVQTTLTGLKLAAKIAYFYGVDEVIDNLVVNLFKATNILTPGIQKAMVYFGMKEKAQLATESAFFIANKYTSSLGSAGWRSVMDCVIRLHQLGILSQNFWEDGDTEMEDVLEPSIEFTTNASSSGASLSATLWPWSSRDVSLTDQEKRSQQQAIASIQKCEIKTVFKDTKFLRLESLLELIRAISWASSADEKTTLICLELLFYTASRNKDRIKNIWPEIEAHLEEILTSNQHPYEIQQCAVFGILKVCQRSLIRHGLSGVMMKILRLVPKIDNDYIVKMADSLAKEIFELIKFAAAFIDDESVWEAICLLLQKTLNSNSAFTAGMDALSFLAKNGEHVKYQNFRPILEACKVYKNNAYPETIVFLLDLIRDMVKSISTWPDTVPVTNEDQEEEDMDPNFPLKAKMWRAAVSTVREISYDSEQEVRNHAISILHTVIAFGESLNISSEIWETVFYEDLLVTVRFFLGKQTVREYKEVDKTLRSSIKILTRTFLQLLNEIKALPQFPDIWLKMLSYLQQSYMIKSDELTEAVPEEVKNLLLVMNKEDILVKDWVDENGNDLWNLSWRKAKEISFSLTPEVLL